MNNQPNFFGGYEESAAKHQAAKQSEVADVLASQLHAIDMPHYDDHDTTATEKFSVKNHLTDKISHNHGFDFANDQAGVYSLTEREFHDFLGLHETSDTHHVSFFEQKIKNLKNIREADEEHFLREIEKMENTLLKLHNVIQILKKESVAENLEKHDIVSQEIIRIHHNIETALGAGHQLSDHLKHFHKKQAKLLKSATGSIIEPPAGIWQQKSGEAIDKPESTGEVIDLQEKRDAMKEEKELQKFLEQTLPKLSINPVQNDSKTGQPFEIFAEDGLEEFWDEEISEMEVKFQKVVKIAEDEKKTKKLIHLARENGESDLVVENLTQNLAIIAARKNNRGDAFATK